MGNALLHLDIGAAFGYNPLALIGLAVVTILGGLWTMELVGGPAVRLPSGVRNRLAATRQATWLIAGLFSMVVYTVLRNL